MFYSQFSNMLVIAAVYLDPKLRPLVPIDDFLLAMHRTLTLLSRLAPLSPIYRINYTVLQCAASEVVEQRGKSGYPVHLDLLGRSPITLGGASDGHGTPQHYQVAPASATSSFSGR
jgi:hypothetical protein